ncbi:uncharacterized protein METZ01_LOCUS480032 [marine metagenome]|uniref:NADPH-dependent FMN reductase-like domain-containing protein n=1 Tax=marine metagenome TaxID=408172 RepID=A0A383C6G3_9ZZZZ
MAYLVISSSLNSQSRSRLLAQIAFRALEQMEVHVEWIDLSEYSIPLCDGDLAYENFQVKELADKIHHVKGVLIAVPIYNYYANAAAKNLIELTGKAWSNKVVGFLCAAGGKGSYMSVMGLANSLMLDFRCLIIPRFVYFTGEAFEGGKVSDPGVEDRVNELTKELKRICIALNK